MSPRASKKSPKKQPKAQDSPTQILVHAIQDYRETAKKREAEKEPPSMLKKLSSVLIILLRIMGSILMIGLLLYLYLNKLEQPMEIVISSKNLQLQLPPSDHESEILKGLAIDSNYFRAQGFKSFSLIANIDDGQDFSEYQIEPLVTNKADVGFTSSSGVFSLVSLNYEGEMAIEISTDEAATSLRFSNEIGDRTLTAFAEISLPDSFRVNSYTCKLKSLQDNSGLEELQNKKFVSSAIEPSISITNYEDYLTISLDNSGLMNQKLFQNLSVTNFQPNKFDRNKREYVSTLNEGYYKFPAQRDTSRNAISPNTSFRYQTEKTDITSQWTNTIREYVVGFLKRVNIIPASGDDFSDQQTGMILRELKVIEKNVYAKFAGNFASFKICQTGSCKEVMPTLLSMVTQLKYGYFIIGFYILVLIRLAFGEKVLNFVVDLLKKNPVK